jgi:hypothetical protein
MVGLGLTPSPEMYRRLKPALDLYYGYTQGSALASPWAIMSPSRKRDLPFCSPSLDRRT